ncbi:putative beta-1 adrenergic receptor [Trichinella spiralis]|uniref:putative beta-1 adrenergic receptor n=1 Tax=Trichinella spiralis TaxID=6334 RepID=UPI0001EFDDC0|nr:putative beta-1 adrenergic receptor [Trichinella spiralis]
MNHTDKFDFAVDILTLVCAPLTVFFNTIVLYIAFQHVDMKQRLNQRFVVSMTVADLVYGLVYMSTRLYINYIPRWLCGPYYMTLWTCQIASVVFLLCLNIDKYISIRYPLRYPSVVTETVKWALVVLHRHCDVAWCKRELFLHQPFFSKWSNEICLFSMSQFARVCKRRNNTATSSC